MVRLLRVFVFNAFVSVWLCVGECVRACVWVRDRERITDKWKKRKLLQDTTKKHNHVTLAESNERVEPNFRSRGWRFQQVQSKKFLTKKSHNEENKILSTNLTLPYSTIIIIKDLDLWPHACDKLSWPGTNHVNQLVRIIPVKAQITNLLVSPNMKVHELVLDYKHFLITSAIIILYYIILLSFMGMVLDFSHYKIIFGGTFCRAGFGLDFVLIWTTKLKIVT